MSSIWQSTSKGFRSTCTGQICCKDELRQFSMFLPCVICIILNIIYYNYIPCVICIIAAWRLTAMCMVAAWLASLSGDFLFSSIVQHINNCTTFDMILLSDSLIGMFIRWHLNFFNCAASFDSFVLLLFCELQNWVYLSFAGSPSSQLW